MPTDENKDEVSRMKYWAVTNSLMTLLIVFKLMYFMKVSVNLATVVKLTHVVFRDVAAFSLFLLFWITTFVLLYLIAGVKL